MIKIGKDVTIVKKNCCKIRMREIDYEKLRIIEIKRISTLGSEWWWWW